MSAVHWTNAVSADFSTAADWNVGGKAGHVPGASDDAILDAPGATAYTVTASTSYTVNSIQTAASATLAIASGTFTATKGTGAGTGANTGSIQLGDATNFDFGGTLSNGGVIGVNSTNDTTIVEVLTNATLTGGGRVTLSDNTNNYIQGASASTTLNNVNDTISGAGVIGNGQLILTNGASGIIDASGTNALTVDVSGTLSNLGLLEATGAGGLSIDSTTIANGGTILAATGAIIRIGSADIIGGTLGVAGGGTIETTDSSSVFDGSKAILTSLGAVQVSDATYFTLRGSIANSGVISVDSSNDTTVLQMAVNTTLSGAGTIKLSDNANNYVQGATDTVSLTNVDNTISGAGQIGNGQLTLINGAAGVIDATGGSVLTLSTGAASSSNGGVIEATGTGGLSINSSTFANSGMIEAIGKGALTVASSAIANASGGQVLTTKGGHISLQAGAVAGGTLTVVSGSQLTADGGTSSISAATFNNQGAVSVNDAAWLTLQGTIGNSGAIDVLSSNDTTVLQVGAANATLTGGGAVTLSDNSNNYIQGVAAGDVLDNVDNTISGAGQFGNGQMTVVNGKLGVIDATGTNALVISLGAATLTNAGLIEATGKGGLSINSTAVANSGTIAAAAGSTVSIASVDVIGGTLGVAGGGTIRTVDSGSLLDGATAKVGISNVGSLQITDGTYLTVQGAVGNTGAIQVNSSNDTTVLEIGAAGATLTGGGTITLTDNANNYIQGVGGAVVLDNVDNTISGAGQFGNGQLALVNGAKGVIDATGTQAMNLNTSSATITNAGLIEVGGPGGMTISSTLANTGTLLAHGSKLTLVGALTNISGATLTGGTYEADGGATLELPQNVSIVTDKATVILNGAKSVLESYNTTTSAEVAIDTTLAAIAANGALELLAGRNWSTKLAMSNAGVLQLGGGSFSAKSLVNSGTLTGYGAVTTTINDSGTIAAQAGQTLNLHASTITPTTGATFIVGAGGTFQAPDNTVFQTLDFTVVLNGIGSVLQSLNTSNSTEVTFEAGSTGLSATGVLEILGGRSYTTANAYANAGVIQLAGGTFSTGVLTGATGSSLTGFGAVASVFVDSGSVTASGGALAFSGAGNVFAGAISGTEVDFTGGGDTLNTGASLSVSAIGLSGGAGLTLGESLGFAGAVNEAAGATVSVGSNTLTLTGSGSSFAGSIGGGGALVLSAGSQTLNAGATISTATWSLVNGDAVVASTSLSYAGSFTEDATSSLTVGSGDTLGLSGSVGLSGAVNGAGALSQSGGNETVNAGATIGLSAWSLTNSAALTLDENLSFTGALTEDATSSITIAAGDTLTVTGAATLAGAFAATGALSLGAGSKTTINGAATVASAFSEGSATATVLSGDTLALKGASTFSAGANINGAGVVTVVSASLTGLTIGGTATFTDAGSVDQTGAITIGDATASAAKLTISKGATYKIDGNVGIARGKSSASTITVGGTLLKASGSGVSIVAVKVVDSGQIEAGTGTLDFTQALTGKGGMKIDAGATLEVANTAASTLTATFNGAGATLALTKASKFAATIAGFTTGQTIDLVKTAATAATINGSDQLVIVNGTTAVATLQLAGTYTGAVFNVASDGHGGSAITLAAAPMQGAGGFVQAMAGIVGSNGAAVGPGQPGAGGLQVGPQIALAAPARHPVAS
jgi:hypothetical protein